MSDITLTPVRYYTDEDVYHYTVDNRPLQDLAANDDILKAAIEELQQTTFEGVPGSAPAANALDGSETIVGMQNGEFVSITVSQIVTYLMTAMLIRNLIQWAYSLSFQIVSATRDANEAILTADILWPDGVSGTYTADILSTDFPGATDAWHATYNSVYGIKSITQPLVTRDANGAVIAQPAIIIA